MAAIAGRSGSGSPAGGAFAFDAGRRCVARRGYVPRRPAPVGCVPGMSLPGVGGRSTAVRGRRVTGAAPCGNGSGAWPRSGPGHRRADRPALSRSAGQTGRLPGHCRKPTSGVDVERCRRCQHTRLGISAEGNRSRLCRLVACAALRCKHDEPYCHRPRKRRRIRIPVSNTTPSGQPHGNIGGIRPAGIKQSIGRDKEKGRQLQTTSPFLARLSGLSTDPHQ